MTNSVYANTLKSRALHGLYSAALLGSLTAMSACTRPGIVPQRPPSPDQPSTTAAEDKQQIQHAETVWAKSLESGDAQQLATIIAPTFTFIGPDGQVEDRKAYLAGYEQLPTLGLKVESIEMSEVDLRFFGEIAVVTGRVIAKLKMKDEPITEDVRFTRVYQRSPRGWLMVSGQGTRLSASGS